MPEKAINGVRLKQKRLAELAWKLDKFRWVMYEVKLDNDTGKILGEIMYLSGRQGFLSENHDDLKSIWLLYKLIDLGFDGQLAIETINKIFERTPLKK